MTSPFRAVVAGLFSPASTLIGRLRYAQKFTLVGLVLIVPLAVVANAYIGLQQDRVRDTQRELVGLDYLMPILNYTGDVIVARHVALTSEHDDMLDIESATEKIDALDAKYGAMFNVSSEWARARALVLTAFRSKKQTKAYRFNSYNTALDQLRSLAAHIGDNSRLIRDPDIDSYYLADVLQLRIMALADSATRSADRVELCNTDRTDCDFQVFTELGIYHGSVSTNRTVITQAIQTVLANTSDSTVRETVGAQYRKFDKLTGALGDRLAMAEQTRSTLEYPSFVSDDLRIAAGVFATTIANGIHALLATRIGKLDSRVRQVELLAGFGTGIAVYLFVGFYRSVSAPIRNIVATLRSVAAGDLTKRVRVTTHDELHFVATVLNETLAKTEAATERLAVQATRDALTALPNRTVAIDRLDHALARSQRNGTLVAAIFIDLDHFKPINDSLGHDAGDDVLRVVAERLATTTRASDTVARLAGDEFVVISEDLVDETEANRIAERIVDQLSEPITIVTESGEREVTIGASVGIAFGSGETGLTSGNLLRDSDVAMYRAKQRGRGRVEVFDDSLRADVQRRLETQSDLRQAIDTEQLRVFYQPIVRTSDGALLGFEALIRWQHPTRGLLPPGCFIDIAEDSGLIVPIGAQVLTEACRQTQQWRTTRTGCDRLHIAVNVSAAQFDHPGFVPTVANVLDVTGIDPDALVLEITETSILADVKAAANTLDAIRSLGVHLSVDDFGTGYTSLTYLRQFPVETLKIDKSFVDGLGANREDEAIVTMLINLANSLNLTVVAEGVETCAQHAKLRELGADSCQGYYFGKPAAPDVAWNSITETLTLLPTG